MLSALSRLGAVGTQVIRQSKTDTAANLAALRPILGQLTKAGDDLPRSLQLLLTYPFSDSTTGAMKGDYTNMSADLDLDLTDLVGDLGLPTAPPTGRPTTPGPGLPTGPLPPLPTLPTLPSVPGLPSLPGLPGRPSSTSTTSPPPGPCSIPLLCPGGGS
jgi:phospholipid/cholesterol/gamma-HCH transport system substrate-binding protein